MYKSRHSTIKYKMIDHIDVGTRQNFSRKRILRISGTNQNYIYRNLVSQSWIMLLYIGILLVFANHESSSVRK